MRVAIHPENPILNEEVRSWGWEIEHDSSAAGLDAILLLRPDAMNGIPAGRPPVIYIGDSESTEIPMEADDFLLGPPAQSELTLRIQRALSRRARLIKLVHDLRTPLNAIQGYAELIGETAEPETLRYSEKIRTAVTRMAEQLQVTPEQGL